MVSKLKLTKYSDIRAIEGDLLVGEVNVLLLIFEKFMRVAEINQLESKRAMKGDFTDGKVDFSV
jgi:hypothetical protein